MDHGVTGANALRLRGAITRGGAALVGGMFITAALAGWTDVAHAQAPAGAGAPPPAAAGTPGIDAAKQSGDAKGAEGGNRVNRSIQFGFTRDPGAASVMDHKIRDAGIALPQCVEESRDGQACK